MAIKRSTIKVKNPKPGKKLQKKNNPRLDKNPEIENPKPGKNPDVILDFEYDEGLLFIVIENIGNDSAYNASVRFNKKVLGMQKTKNISSLRIFQSLKFLPPGKKIKILVDLFQFYLACKQPMKISTAVVFRNKSKQIFQNSIQHDLSIYKEFAEIYYVKKTI